MVTREFERERLPQEIVGPSNARNIAISVGGALVLAFLINFGAVWFLGRHTTNLGYAMVRTKWDMLSNLDQPVDWLILGDSSGGVGVLPNSFNGNLDTTSVNLCTIGNMMALGDAWMLEAYIEQHGAPQGVLIVHAYDIWQRDPDPATMAQVPLGWGYWNDLQSRVTLPPEDTAWVFLHRYVPVYTQTKALARILKSPWSLFAQGSRSRFDMDGFLAIEEPDPEVVQSDLEAHLAFLEGNRFALSDANRQALDSISQSAEEHGFEVYYATSPLYDGLAEREEFQMYFGQIQAMLDEYAAESPRTHNITPQLVTFGAHQMQNVDHVIRSAAEIYTDILTERIRALQE